MSSGSNKTGPVLIIDDDLQVRRSLQLYLASCGLEIEAFSSGEEFLQVADQRQPACMIVDFRLPGINGLELLRRLAKRHIRVPTVLYTAYGDDNVQASARELGVAAIVSKPSPPRELLARVLQLINS